MPNRNKILLVPEFSSFGGTRSYFKALLKLYSSQNYEVVIALCKYQLDDDIKSLLKQYKYKVYLIPSREEGIKKYLRYFPINLFFDIIYIFPIYRKEKPSLIVISNGTPGMFIGLILFPVNFIYTFHTYPLKGKFIFLATLQKLFLSLCLNRGKIIITVSEYSKEQIVNFWVPRVKSNHIGVIYNSVKEELFIDDLSQKKHVDVHRILTLGHVTWYKNPKLWIEVAQEVIRQRPNIPLEFIWAGEGNLLDECKEMVKQIEFIKFIGYQSKVDSLYNESTIYFQPSLLENHSISVVEAMAHGLPCVTSDSGGLPESVVNGETGFTCSADNVNCFVSCIVRLLDDNELRTRMGHSGRLRAETLFSEEVQHQKMINLYTSLLHQ
ncbi:MAG: glycosyltransferase family 4 protein [Methanolobus sp.]|uniref:glycosyltransferase family 4 protein n=1 Tax=Methanolobus sp. TaxID=1874737 RepID=UPI002730D8F8|nr:glycosyltransferase family 4 protein [Methanolobus sp.]MDP2217462.1 glycosyltransferase family 4 protein [Methanolobus sp.]